MAQATHAFTYLKNLNYSCIKLDHWLGYGETWFLYLHHKMQHDIRLFLGISTTSSNLSIVSRKVFLICRRWMELLQSFRAQWNVPSEVQTLSIRARLCGMGNIIWEMSGLEVWRLLMKWVQEDSKQECCVSCRIWRAGAGDVPGLFSSLLIVENSREACSRMANLLLIPNIDGQVLFS